MGTVQKNSWQAHAPKGKGVARGTDGRKAKHKRMHAIGRTFGRRDEAQAHTPRGTTYATPMHKKGKDVTGQDSENVLRRYHNLKKAQRRKETITHHRPRGNISGKYREATTACIRIFLARPPDLSGRGIAMLEN